jgi:hypothetical protein
MLGYTIDESFPTVLESDSSHWIPPESYHCSLDWGKRSVWFELSRWQFMLEPSLSVMKQPELRGLIPRCEISFIT